METDQPYHISIEATEDGLAMLEQLMGNCQCMLCQYFRQSVLIGLATQEADQASKH